MQILFKKFKKKIDGAIMHLIINGIILFILGILIVWTDFVLRLVVGLVVIVVAYTFFYLAYKIILLKKELEKYFKL